MAAVPRSEAAAPPGWGPQALAMVRAAQAVAHPGGPTLFADLVRELAETLQAATVFVAVFADEKRTHMRTLAARMDGRALQNFDYPLEGSPCAKVVGRVYRYVATGVATEFPPGTIFGAKGMDCYAAFPLTDSGGAPLGLLVAMDRAPIADAALAEALLKIFAGRMAAEIEGSRADEALRAAALAVSSARGASVFDELVRFLATQLRVEVAFIARHEEAEPGTMRTLAMVYDGQIVHDLRYPIAGTPCETVFGHQFRAYPSGLGELFPDDPDVELQGTVSYAGYPLTALDGQPLGNISVASRRPLTQLDRLESLLQIFAVRAAAEIEQQAAREALQRSEASYRTIFEATEDAVFIHDWDSGRILDVNPKACTTYGYSRDELREVSVADLSSGVPPYTAEHAMAHLQQARLGRCPPFEWHRRNRDGSLHWDEVRLKPVQIDGRRRILAFTREITEHKAALAALQARGQQYRAIFDGSGDAMGLWDTSLRLVDVNEAFVRIRGLPREAVIGRLLTEREGEPQAALREAMIRDALAGREGRMELLVPTAGGEISAYEVRYVPVRFGGVDYALSVARDVTERRMRELALQRSEARLRATVEAAFDCVIGMDGEGRIVEFNAAAERCFGHRRDDVMGRLLADVILPERHRQAHTRGLKHFHASGRGPMVGRLVETSALRADGSEIPVELAISVAAVPEGSIFVGHLRDISARRAAEAERAALESQLRQAQKMEAIGQLTGGIAHDFNNILTSVIGYLVLGQERAETLADATLVRQLGQAHLAAQRARDLIAQMLAFARRQRGEQRVLPLAPLVRQTLQLLRATLPASVAVDSAGLPDDDGAAARVLADPVQLEQVLFNLCINARDAIDGPGTIRVRLRESGGGFTCASCRSHAAGGRWVELSVADSGSGIAPEVLERMFEPFFSTKEVGRGSGMGLAMVHGIVHDHGGHVEVRTAPGAGTEFRVLLPPAAAGAPVQPDSAPPRPDAAPLPPARVLLVEDEVLVGDFMTELLAGWGLQVHLERDPQRAAAWLEDPAHAADCLVSDQTMPQMTGLALARHAHALRPRLPVLLYSGNAAAIDAAEARRHGVVAVLAKPVDPPLLRAALQRCLAAPAAAAGGVA
ncbi:MAG: PAS domain S-box protein [Rubrivivax sp.]|nr:PAS domain S-box protein [Rubrivivax sp.]